MNISLVSGLIFAGIIQGIVFGFVVLLVKKYNQTSSRYLGGLILSFALANLQFSLQEFELYSEEFLYDYVYIPWAFLVPPLLYSYVRTFLYPDRPIRSIALWLYAPFIFISLWSIAYKIFSALDSDLLFNTAGHNIFWDFVDLYADFINVVLNLMVIYLLLKAIHIYERGSKPFKMEAIRLQLFWLKATLWVLLIHTTFWGYFTFAYVMDTNTAYVYVYIGVSVTIYWLGYVGIYKIGIREQRKKLRQFAQQRSHTITDVTSKSEHIQSLEQILISEKRFLDPNLSLEQVAFELEISKGYLSKLINNELGNSFKDYINTLRVEEAKSYLTNPEFRNYTLVAIGLEAGFNSKSAFNASFKKITGKTPSEFKKLANES